MNKKTISKTLPIITFFLGVLITYLTIINNPLITKTITETTNNYKIEDTAIEIAIDKVYDAVVVVESFQTIGR